MKHSKTYHGFLHFDDVHLLYGVSLHLSMLPCQFLGCLSHSLDLGKLTGKTIMQSTLWSVFSNLWPGEPRFYCYQ